MGIFLHYALRSLCGIGSILNGRKAEPQREMSVIPNKPRRETVFVRRRAKRITNSTFYTRSPTFGFSCAWEKQQFSSSRGRYFQRFVFAPPWNYRIKITSTGRLKHINYIIFWLSVKSFRFTLNIVYRF